MRSRESRITCQAGPLIGRETAPARQPFAYEPIARTASGAGAATPPNRWFAGGPFGAVLTPLGGAEGWTAVVFADFLIGLEGWTAVVFADFLIGSAATDPQTNNNNAQAITLCIIRKLRTRSPSGPSPRHADEQRLAVRQGKQTPHINRKVDDWYPELIPQVRPARLEGKSEQNKLARQRPYIRSSILSRGKYLAWGVLTLGKLRRRFAAERSGALAGTASTNPRLQHPQRGTRASRCWADPHRQVLTLSRKS